MAGLDDAAPFTGQRYVDELQDGGNSGHIWLIG